MATRSERYAFILAGFVNKDTGYQRVKCVRTMYRCLNKEA